MTDYIFTSESVSAGHPDKICDQISDCIVDAYLREDPTARVAVETLVTTRKVVIAGEVRSNAAINAGTIEQLARDTIREIGYDTAEFGWNSVDVDVYVHEQSEHIAQGVDAGVSVNAASRNQGTATAQERARASAGEGAGDQGIMFGYAVNETDQLMPATIHYAHRLMESLYRAWRAGDEPKLGPDAKSQLSIRYLGGKPVHIDTVVLSTQHKPEASLEEIRERALYHASKVLPQEWVSAETNFIVNPTGKFVIGGPHGDAGLTGRKIVVDTYGGAAPHGGGAFSGKDPSKVDRSAAYAARYLAKNIVAAGVCNKCLIQIGYAIGVAEPVAIYFKLSEDSAVPSEHLAKTITSLCDLRPSGIRERLDLHQAIYLPTATFGHFGRQYDATAGTFPWERLDLAGDIKRALA